MTNETFNTSFKKYYQRMAAYACELVQDAQAAEDIVQDAFVKLLTTPDETFNTEAGIKAWLYASVRNGCFNYLKRDARICGLDESLVARFEAAGELKELIMSINPNKARETLQLFSEGYNRNEIAEKLGVSDHTVKNNRAYGIYLIRKFLKLTDK